jgi:hypothetical protein
MTDLAGLASKYETALAAHYDKPADEKLHKAAMAAAEKLASARRLQRETDIGAGIRSEGISVIAEKEGEE